MTGAPCTKSIAPADAPQLQKIVDELPDGAVLCLGEEAADWYKRPADAGSAKAAAHLSRMYASREGVAVDDAQSQYWFAHASSAGKPWSRQR